MYALAAILLGGTLSPEFAARIWYCEIACHFQVQYILGLAMVASVFAVTRRRWTAGVVILAALLAFVVRWMPIYWPEVPRAQGPRSLRLLSANLRFNNDSHELFLELIDRERPDVILVFELSPEWLPDLQLLSRDYPHSKVLPSPGHSGCGVYSRLPLEYAAIDGVDPDPCLVVVARVLVKDAVVSIFGVHPLAPYTYNEMLQRNSQLANFAERFGQNRRSTIIAGDFNTSGWSPCFGQVMRATGTRDTRCGFGVSATFPARYWPVMIPIDHCLVSQDIGVVDRRVGPSIGSDHLPIIVDLQITEAGK